MKTTRLFWSPWSSLTRLFEVAIEPKTKAGQDKMTMALLRLAEEDPTFKTYTNQETGQTIIAGMGELHLEIIVDRLLREFKVEATVGKPQVTYKATIRKTVKAEGRFVRQTGGHGQYGHCWVEISPERARQGLRVRIPHRRRRDSEGIHRAYRRWYPGRGQERLSKASSLLTSRRLLSMVLTTTLTPPRRRTKSPAPWLSRPHWRRRTPC